MIAHVLVSKYLLGVPFYRLEQTFELQGFSLDRGTMSRYAEDVGATGVRIQPGPLQERKRGPCHKGHFFVVLADRDHIFFEYQERHTSVAVCSMFKGYSGYLQADAHAVYDALFAGRPPVGRPPDPDQGPPPKEVGCWSHCRRGFWEAAVCKQALGVEGLRRIDAIFTADRAFADLPPATRKLRREERVRPLVDAFFAWVEAESVVPRPRGYPTAALGCARNQVGPLRRFLEDGRLRLENNESERALRYAMRDPHPFGCAASLASHDAVWWAPLPEPPRPASAATPSQPPRASRYRAPRWTTPLRSIACAPSRPATSRSPGALTPPPFAPASSASEVPPFWALPLFA